MKPLLPQPRRDLRDTALAVCCLSFPELNSQAELCGSCPLSVGHIFGQVQVSASHSTCPVLKFNPHLLWFPCPSTTFNLSSPTCVLLLLPPPGSRLLSLTTRSTPHHQGALPIAHWCTQVPRARLGMQLSFPWWFRIREKIQRMIYLDYNPPLTPLSTVQLQCYWVSHIHAHECQQQQKKRNEKKKKGGSVEYSRRGEKWTATPDLPQKQLEKYKAHPESSLPPLGFIRRNKQHLLLWKKFT